MPEISIAMPIPDPHSDTSEPAHPAKQLFRRHRADPFHVAVELDRGAAGELLESIAAIPSGDPFCLFSPAPKSLHVRNQDL